MWLEVSVGTRIQVGSLNAKRYRPWRTTVSTHDHIRKAVRRDLRRSKTRFIKEAIEQKWGFKVFVKRLGRNRPTNRWRSNRLQPEILSEVEDFYGRLYASQSPFAQTVTCDPRAAVVRYYANWLSHETTEKLKSLRWRGIYNLVFKSRVNSCP